MSVAVALGVLAIVDCMLAGFRAAAGRDGRLRKARYYVHAVARAGAWAAAMLAANVALAAVVCALGAEGTWAVLVDAARPLVWIYGAFATMTLGAFALYFLPIGEARVLTSVIVFGPLTLARPWVVNGGLLFAATTSPDARVWILALGAGLSMNVFEPVLARRYSSRWRELVSFEAHARNDREHDACREAS